MASLSSLSLTAQITFLEQRLARAEAGRERIDLLNRLAWELSDIDPPRAAALADEAAALAASGQGAERPYHPGIADSLACRAFISRLRGDYPAALALADEAITVGSACERREAVCRASWVAGRIYGQWGEYARALQSHLRQLDASTQIADQSFRAMALTCVGLVYDDTSDYPTALRYHTAALECAREAGAGREEATSLVHLCWSNLQAGSYAEALRFGSEGLVLVETYGSERMRLILLNNLGVTYTRLGRPGEALGCFRQVLGQLDEQSEPFLQVFAAKWAGTLYREQHDLDRAEQHLTYALSIARRIRQVRDEYECHEQLGLLHKERGAIATALEHFEQVSAIKTHAFRHELSSRLDALELAHRAAAAEREAEHARRQQAELEHEVAERRRAEARLQDQNDRLEEIVAERTRALSEAQEQLLRREKLAALGQLAGGVAHELRNPLGVISNAVYYLQIVLPDATPKTREYLEIIQTRVFEAERIITALLNFARSRPLQPELTDVAPLIHDALRSLARPTQVEVAVTIEPGMPPVTVDPQQIRQALINLVVNAYEAMAGGGSLRIMACRAPDERAVLIRVSDTGPGIAEETRGRIFEPLFSTKPHGIGLGLAVAKNLVEVNGGRIWAEALPDQGGSFALVLPTDEGRP